MKPNDSTGGPWPARSARSGPEHPEVGVTLNNLAVVCRRRGNHDEAQALYRRAIDLLSATVEPTHPALVASRGNLSRLLGEGKPGEQA